jgi:thiamine biosynthesis protein ThiS
MEPTMFTITINGETKTLPGLLSVAELVDHLGLDPKRIAVEVNRELVPRSTHGERRLAAGDAVEIVTFVGGGAC